MPESMLPPPEAANADGVLLLWVVYALCAVVVFLFVFHQRQMTTQRTEFMDRLKADAESRKEMWGEMTSSRLEQAKLSERILAALERITDVIERKMP